MSEINLNQPELYINRELSALQFNMRVLAQARDPNIPLLERLRFLLICDSNLDEFFEIRVAGLKQQIALGSNKPTSDGLTPVDVLKKISEIAHNIVREKYQIFSHELLPALKRKGILLLEAKDWSKRQTEWTKDYFLNQVLPVLSPIGLDLAHPFPRVVNKSLNFIVELKGNDAFGRTSGLAIIHAPRSLPRVIAFPAQKNSFVLLSTLISHYASELFPGMKVEGCYQFRITRNSELFVDEDKTDDLLLALKNQLLNRLYSNAVRLEIAANCPEHLIKNLCQKIGLHQEDTYLCPGPVNLSRLFAMLKLVQHDDLCFPLFSPGTPEGLKQSQTIFDCLKEKDILLQLPYQSFHPVVSFIQQAAYDPNVLAIKITLYRTEENSLIVTALLDAARAGKEVTAIVELRARFDEAENIALANRLQEAGALVAYGVVGYKTHAKMTLVIRREQNELKRYVHLSTGNYHSGTATQYTDYGLLTSQHDIAEDVHLVFQQLTGMGKFTDLHYLLQAPFTLHKTLIQLIDDCITTVKEGKPSRIIFKVNALTEMKIIQALYRASQAGVKIQLIVRSLCCLRPGIPGVSDNIEVSSIVGRFLEHHRIFYFEQNGKSTLYLASADLMERNCFHRVEVAFPILDAQLIEEVKQNSLFLLLQDNCQRWQLSATGEYELTHSSKKEPSFCAQQTLLEKLAK